MAKSMFKARNKAIRQQQQELTEIIKNMRCPACHQPPMTISIKSGLVACPHCAYKIIDLGSEVKTREQFLKDYEGIVSASLGSVAEWFDGNQVAAGFFLAWLGKQCARELQ